MGTAEHLRWALVRNGKVAALEETLNDPGIRLEASEILRSLIDKIVVTPECQLDGPYPNCDQLREEPSSKISIVLWGELATIIGLAEDAKPFENKNGFSLIAGARNHRRLTLPAVLV